MSSEPGIEIEQLSTEQIEEQVAEFLRGIVKAPVPVDEDLFATGLVASIVAMQLVVHLETRYGIAITGSNLRLDNFRTVQLITALVQQLQEPSL